MPMSLGLGQTRWWCRRWKTGLSSFEFRSAGETMYEIKIESLSLQDLLRPDILADPYPVFRRLRLEDPIHEDPNGEGWIISRYDDVAFVLADRRFSAERTLPQGAESAGAQVN